MSTGEPSFLANDYKTADIKPIEARELTYRFHETTNIVERVRNAETVARWSRLRWINCRRFKIPCLEKYDARLVPSAGNESPQHVRAKASIGAWLQANAGPIAYEDDGIDVTCAAGRVWAECGNTYFNRFEMLLDGWHRVDCLLLVSKAPRDGKLDVLGFQPTAAGGINYAGQQMVRWAEFESRAEASWQPATNGGKGSES